MQLIPKLLFFTIYTLYELDLDIEKTKYFKVFHIYHIFIIKFNLLDKIVIESCSTEILLKKLVTSRILIAMKKKSNKK